VGLSPRYGSDGIAVVGYQANHQLELTSHDIDRVTDLIAAFAAAAGNALTINRISLSLNDPEPLAEQAREAAFASAQTKAEQFARLSGRARRRRVGSGERGPVAGLDLLHADGRSQVGHEQRLRRDGGRRRRDHRARHCHGPLVSRRPLLSHGRELLSDLVRWRLHEPNRADRDNI
jgi:hypothetical protein